MSATTTTTTQPIGTTSYHHNVPVQDVDYSKEQYVTNPAPSTYSSSVYQQNTAAPVATGQQTMPNVSIFLRPIAAPSALGWMSFFGGTFCLFTWNADWYGGSGTYIDLATFVFFFGGLCQLVAGFHGYNARDNFATVWFTLWGAFFLSWSYWVIYVWNRQFLNGATQTYFNKYATLDGFGMWFVILAAVSWACFLPALARDITSGVIVLLAAIGATLEMAYFSGRSGYVRTIKAGSYFLLVSGIIGLFRGWLYLLEEAFYETPLATRFIPKYRTPFQQGERPPVSIGVNEPGVRKGQ